MIDRAASRALRRFVAALLLVYCGKQVATAFFFPPFSGHDELAHFEYIRVLADQHRLPTLYTDPLPHDLYRYSSFAIAWPDEWWSPLYTAVHPPLYYAAMTPVYRMVAARSPEQIQYVLRCAAIPFGAATVLLAYLLARLLFPASRFMAVTVPAIIAFQPQVSYEAAMVNNDILAIALYTLIVYLLVRVLRDGVTASRALAIGCVTGLALLSKGTTITALALIPLTFAAARRGEPWRRVLAMTILAFVPVVAIAGPWFWFMTRTYGDPMAFRALADTQPDLVRNDRTLLDFLVSGSFLMDRWAETWGEFGWRLVHIGGAVPMALWTVQLGALAGLVRLAAAPLAWTRREWWRSASFLLLAVVCALAYLGMAQFGTRFMLTQARYAFQAAVPAAALTMLGLRAWTPARWRRLAQALVVLAAIGVNVIIYGWHAVPFWYGPHAAHFGLALIAAGAAAVMLCGLAVAVPADSRPEATRAGWLRETLEGPFDRRGALVCTAVTIALSIFAMWQMGAFLPRTTYHVPDTFASFDHPFHIARAVTLLRSLQHGESLRWIASHQGGYPAEFYPFGFAWFEILGWALTLGRFSIPLIHKFAVIALFLSPALLFRAMARRDGWPPLVALSAFALHVSVPGGMWQGGYGELVYVGLVANVSAAVLAVAAMIAASDAFSGSRRALVVAAACSAASIWCNPRSAIALVVCVGAAAIVSLAPAPGRLRAIAATLAAMTALAALLAAPELVSLVRYRSLYYFIRFTAYANALEYSAASIDAVSLPGFLCALAGLAAALVCGWRRSLTKTTAAALMAYVSVTLILSFGATSLVSQLETTRLMPVQRLLTIYLAAVGLHAIAAVAAARLRRRWLQPTVQAAAVAALLFVFLGPLPLLSFWTRGLYEVTRSTTPSTSMLQQVLDIADTTAPPGTAILIVGSNASIHQQLWAPVKLDRLFFYDDWMWYWHPYHRGPYEAGKATSYDWNDLEEIFEPEYLQRNAIGAVVVSPDGDTVAQDSLALTRQFGGEFGLYSVRHPVPVVTFGARPPDTLTILNERIDAEGTSDGGVTLIRRNWFPRWRAELNGRPVAIDRTEDGYMQINVPPGRAHLVLTYRLLAADIAARIAAAAGVIAALILLLRRSRPGRPAVRPGDLVATH